LRAGRTRASTPPPPGWWGDINPCNPRISFAGWSRRRGGEVQRRVRPQSAGCRATRSRQSRCGANRGRAPGPRTRTRRGELRGGGSNGAPGPRPIAHIRINVPYLASSSSASIICTITPRSRRTTPGNVRGALRGLPRARREAVILGALLTRSRTSEGSASASTSLSRCYASSAAGFQRHLHQPLARPSPAGSHDAHGVETDSSPNRQPRVWPRFAQMRGRTSRPTGRDRRSRSATMTAAPPWPSPSERTVPILPAHRVRAAFHVAVPGRSRGAMLPTLRCPAMRNAARCRRRPARPPEKHRRV